jgi:[ribosomal protein S5]-alanine N-acetyltransferase
MDIATHPQFQVGSLKLVGLNQIDAKQLNEFYQRNQDFFNQFNLNLSHNEVSLDVCQRILDGYTSNFENDRTLTLVILDDERAIGIINFSFINRGALNSCFVRFELDFDYQSQGIMTKALEKSIAYIFTQKQLSRIYANHHPLNSRTNRLLGRLGFANQQSANDFLDKDYIQCSLTQKAWNKHKLTA